MSNFGSIGGLMLGIFGLLIAVYGLDVHEPFASQVFFLGVVCAASGGIIVWLGNRRQNSSLTPKYVVESQRTESKTDPIPIVGGTQTTYTYRNDKSEVVIVFKNDMVKEKHGTFGQ